MNGSLQHIKQAFVTGLAVILLLITAMPLKVNAFQLDTSDTLASNDMDTPGQVDVRKTDDDEALMVTLNVKNMELADVLKRLTHQAGVGLSFDAEIVSGKKITKQVKDKPFFELLDELFEGTTLGYTVSEDERVLVLKEKIAHDLEADDQTITGSVVDARTGEPLPGVNILLRGTSTGTSSDAEGRFELQVPELTGTLILTYIGYERIEVPLDGRTEVEIELMPGFISGEELVVVGYGVQRERDLSTSISTVRAEDLNRGVQLSPQQLIQGRMAGVNIIQNSGKPGGANTVLIRGGTSVTGTNEPLYVIDGVPITVSSTTRQNNINQGADVSYFDHEPVNPLNALNPNDIESISVLKDASATAIYGSRGANGVIVITTKSGSEGIMEANYDTRFGFSKVANTLDLLNSDQYREINQSLGLSFTDGGANTNWQNEIFRTAYSHSHDLSLSGGTELTHYRASLGYTEQDGVVLGSGLSNVNTRISASHNTMDERLLFTLRLSVAQISSDNAPLSNTVGGESGTNMIWDAYVFNPTLSKRNADGEYVHMSQFSVNPVSYAEHIEDKSITRRVMGNLSTTYQIFDPLSVNMNLALTHQNIGRNSYVSRQSPLGGGFGGRANTLSVEDWNQLIETTFNYNQSFGVSHLLDVIGGYSYQYFVDEGNNIRATGFLTDAFKWNSIQAASTISEVSTFKESNTLISFYSRLNYSFMDKYLFAATVRRDGSSRFGSGNEWGIFPSASVAWRIIGEDFFPDDGIFNDLKVRASYGITGNQEIGNLNSLTTLGALSSGYIMDGSRQTIIIPEQFANPDLKWEETAQLNIGLDYELFNGRIYGKMDYYHKETTDLLLRFDVPSPSVVGSQLANVGAVENKGFEFELGGSVIQWQNTLWNVDVNFSLNRNKVLSLSDDQFGTEEIVYSSPRGAGLGGTRAQWIRPGYAMGIFWGPEFLGIENGVEQFSGDETVIGSAEPDFIFGVGNTIYHKNWDLQINLRGSVGNDVLNNTAINLAYKNNLPIQNVLTSALDDGVERGQVKRYSSRWIEDGSYLRLDNLTLGYTFDVESFGILRSARLYATGQNLFVMTGYSGLDPEVNSDVSGSGNSRLLGIDYLSYPRARTFAIGASFSF